MAVELIILKNNTQTPPISGVLTHQVQKTKTQNSQFEIGSL